MSFPSHSAFLHPDPLDFEDKLAEIARQERLANPLRTVPGGGIEIPKEILEGWYRTLNGIEGSPEIENDVLDLRDEIYSYLAG